MNIPFKYFIFLLLFSIGAHQSYAQNCNATYSVNDKTIKVENLENRRAIIKIIDLNGNVLHECSSLLSGCYDPTTFEVADYGEYYLQIQTFTHWRVKFCDIFEKININGTSGPTMDCPALSANIGDSCDDGNANTQNDEVQADCTCQGTVVPPALDCPTLDANIGDGCDDGNVLTIDDEVQADCSCAGTIPPPVYDCPVLTANIGDACNDGNAVTEDDIVTADCNCEGTVSPASFDCPALSANIGESCDDGNSDSNNDQVTVDCKCEGVIPSTYYDCPTINKNFADRCDDGNADTFNDRIQNDCTCSGEIVDEDLIAHWAFEACDPGMQYDELTADTYLQPGVEEVNASVFLNSGMHSCNPGPDLLNANGNVAVCHGIRPYCFWVDNSDDAFRFSVTIKPEVGKSIHLSRITFFEKAADTYEWLTGDTGPNNPPTTYGWRVLKDGQEIGRRIDIPTTEDWSFEEFFFDRLEIDAFNCTETTISFELLGYCAKDNGADFSIWDLDEVKLYGYTTDPEPLVIENEPKDEIVECDGFGNVVAYQAWLADNGGARVNDFYNNVTWTNDGTKDFETLCSLIGNSGFSDVVFTATDDCGRSVQTTATFSIVDSTPPAFSFIPPDVTISCENPVPTQTVVYIDNCGYATEDFQETIVSGDCPNESEITRNWTITDDCGNQSFASQVITIVDNTPPVFETVPTNVTIECDMPIPSDVPTYSDNCASFNDIASTCSETITPGFCTGQYSITKVWIIADPCGNTSTATQIITVEDNTAPTLSGVPISASQSCALPLPAVPNVTASDNCDPNPSVAFVEFSIPATCGETVVRTWTASDDCGNTFSQSQEITLIDNTGPTITTPAQDATFECNINTNSTEFIGWLNSNGGAEATDDCSGLTWSNNFAGVLTGTCGFSSFVDVTFTATDACGNTSATTARFATVDNTPPTIMTPASNFSVECDGAGNVGSINTWLAGNGGATASDLCTNNVTWTNDYNGLTAGCVATGSAMVTFTATDACGLTAQTTAMVEIVDTQPPFFTAPAANLVVDCNDPTFNTQIQNWLNNNGGATAGDFCSTPTFSNNYDPNNLPPSCGNTTIQFTATDDCGNSSVVGALIIIQNNQPPVFTALPFDGSSMCEPFPIGATNAANDFTNWLNANNNTVAANDACGGGTFIINNWNPNVGFSINCNNNPSGFIEVVWTATDFCGNSTTASASFTVTPVAPTPIPTTAPHHLIADGHDVASIVQNGIINHFAVQLEERVVKLNWTNNTGSLNDYFEIQRSSDGIDFEMIGAYENLADDDSFVFYQQEDNSPNLGANYYRLKTIYLDGTFDYSEIRKVHISDIEDFGLFPNPAQEEVNISLKGYSDIEITVQLVDQLGHVLKEEQIDGQNQVNHRMSLKNVQNGFYGIWIFAEGRKRIGKRLIVNRLY